MTKWIEGIIQERIYISPYKDAVKAVGLKGRYIHSINIVLEDY